MFVFFKKRKVLRALPMGFELLNFSTAGIVSKVIIKANNDVFEGLGEKQKQLKSYQVEKELKEKLAKILNKKQRDIAILINTTTKREQQNTANNNGSDNVNYGQQNKDGDVFSSMIESSNKDNSNITKNNQEFKATLKTKQEQDLSTGTANKKQRAKLEGFGRIIGVSSCKGGVGKSTVAYLLANSLAKQGKKVAFLDLDIYGPSVPSLIGFDGKFEVDGNKKLIPIEKRGVFYASVGFVAEANNALVWRGPMISKLINSLVFNCSWPSVDFTILDLPPGTGDAYLSFFQSFEVEGVLLVSTDNALACSDLARSIAAFKSLNVKVLGCLQNMGDIYEDGILQQVCNQHSINITDRLHFAKKTDKNQSQHDFIIDNFNINNFIKNLNKKF